MQLPYDNYHNRLLKLSYLIYEPYFMVKKKICWKIKYDILHSLSRKIICWKLKYEILHFLGKKKCSVCYVNVIHFYNLEQYVALTHNLFQIIKPYYISKTQIPFNSHTIPHCMRRIMVSNTNSIFFR